LREVCALLLSRETERQDVRIENSWAMFSSYSSKFLDFFDAKLVKNGGAISKEELPQILSN